MGKIVKGEYSCRGSYRDNYKYKGGSYKKKREI